MASAKYSTARTHIHVQQDRYTFLSTRDEDHGRVYLCHLGPGSRAECPNPKAGKGCRCSSPARPNLLRMGAAISFYHQRGCYYQNAGWAIVFWGKKKITTQVFSTLDVCVCGCGCGWVGLAFYRYHAMDKHLSLTQTLGVKQTLVILQGGGVCQCTSF